MGTAPHHRSGALLLPSRPHLGHGTHSSKPRGYNIVIGAYQTPIMGVAEVGLVGAVVFHAFNGLRIILVDFWNIGTRIHRSMFYAVLILWAITMAAFTPRHLMFVFGW